MRIFFLCCVAVFSFLSCKTEINDVGNVPNGDFIAIVRLIFGKNRWLPETV